MIQNPGTKAYVCIGITAILLSACFKPREVEPPAASSSDWVTPTDYNILLSNLKTSISRKNVQNYLRCFNQDSVGYTPATVVYTGNQIVWDSWTLTDEQTYLSNVYNDLSIATGNNLKLTETNLQTFSPDSLQYTGDYSLTFYHSDTTLTNTFIGQLEFVLRMNDFNEWEVCQWTDYESHADSSWSRLKLRYVQ